MKRQSVLAVSSLSLVALAGGAVLDAAFAQARDGVEARGAAVPVTFGTDPGAAHPRYAQKVAYQERAASAQPVSLSYVAEPAAAPSVKAPTAVTVQPGDTVYGIARTHGLTPAELIAANDLAAPYTLALGQRLLLPRPAEHSAVANPERVLPQRAPAPVIAAGEAPAPVQAAPAARPRSILTANIERIEERDKLDALYAVRPGDTLFGLSRRFGVPVADLAAANAMSAPYSLSLGQRLIVPAVVPATPIDARPDTAPVTADKAEPAPDLPPAARTAEAEAFLVDRNASARFDWPLKGAIISSYGQDLDGQRNDGINIAAPAGTPIRAAASGEVVYRGDELAGYGNLLLVKHEDGWVSAYAHAGDILVAKGDRVAKGQVVARVGETGAVSSPQLHFELRHDLQPQDPVKALTGGLEQASLTLGR